MSPPRAEPLFFFPSKPPSESSSEPPERPRFGWLHRPSEPAAGLGLVICNPFGYEWICAHRSIRHFAEGAAAAGVPALRFDYDGTGDSAGTDRDAGRVGAWVASARDAIDALRRATGVEKVCVLGVRFGALIGALAAADRDDVSGFIGVAPLTSGKAYLRELRALQMSMGLTAPPAASVTSADEREAVGFPITSETQAALGAVDLVAQGVRPAGRVLLLDRDDLPATDPWAQRLRALGVAVQQERIAGYTETVLDPHNALVPQAMIDAAIAWTRELAAAHPPRRAPSNPAVSATASIRASAGAPTITETAVFLDDDRTLFGIVSAPDRTDATAPPKRRGVLMLNAGSIHHIGPNRMYVRLARSWAAQGHVVLRADVSGIGDSAPHPGEAENVVYTPHAEEDVARALAFLRRQPGVDGCVIVGLCSGAYNAFKVAVKGAGVDAIVPINPLTFFWKDGMSLDFDYSAHRVTQDARRYSEKVFSLASWKKVFRGNVSLGGVAQVLVRHSASLLSGRGRDVARRFGHRFPDDLAFELDEVARRGIGLHFVFARDDPGMDILRVQGGRAVTRLERAGKLKVDVIDARGHTFTALWAQDALVALLSAIVAGVGA
jgi:pimeloyl-ACP methyl ester carboxylesterase